MGIPLPAIKILDTQTANKIAAGEVVERPSSLVKELVENALDAGATRVTVNVADGGTTAVTVSDNGCGIKPKDAALAFLRHATSKLTNERDLYHISTLGFRGEALASIAAVAKVTMLTRTKHNNEGTKVIVSGGKLISNEPVGCPIGTSIMVENLFYNTPARKKHLKTAAAETTAISDIVTRLALSRPEVNFKLISQNRILLETPGNDRLIDTIAAVNGVKVAKEMLPIQGQQSGIFIKGYVSTPELHRATRTQQTILINGRYVKSQSISNALQQAYYTLLSVRRHPMAVLALEIDLTMVDVNVNPTKTEVRISRERDLCQLLIASVKQALRTLAIIPQVTAIPGSTKQMQLPPTKPQSNKTPLEETQLSTDIMQLRPAPQPQAGGDLTAIVEQIDEPARDMLKEQASPYNDPGDVASFPPLLPVGQVLPLYILTQGPNGLYIIDQHAAHERVLYEHYLQEQDEELDSQLLLIPAVLELNNQENQLLIEQIVTFRKMGFILEHFGGNNYLLRGVPSGFPSGEEAQFFFDVLDGSTDRFHEKLAARLACRGAIKSGQKLTLKEMDVLIEQMSHVDNPYTCPHGRPTIIQLSFEELNKRFKR